MKSILKNILLFLSFVILLALGIYGVKTPSSTPFIPVGSLQAFVSQNGITLKQNERGYFYSFSPFNDYVKDSEEIRSSLITADQIKNGAYKSSFATNKTEDIFNDFKNYFGMYVPEINYKVGKNNTYYKALIGNNKLILYREVTFADNAKEKVLGSTLSFNGGDFVFDNKGNYYSFVRPIDVDFFEKEFNIKLYPQLNEINPVVASKKLFIINPRIAGVIEIIATNDQQIRVNRDANLIEIEEKVKPQNEKYQTSLIIQVKDSLTL